VPNSSSLPTTMDTDKCIPANPDISGIGVRAAIYTQNLLCFLPVILYLWDGEISVDELTGIQDQSTGMLAIAFAILITTASLAAGPNPIIFHYHAAIILDLSWMNNTSTWIWFILYVHKRSGATYKPVGATWSAWRTALWSPVRTYLHGLDPGGSGTGPTTQGGEGNERNRWVAKGRETPLEQSPHTMGATVCSAHPGGTRTLAWFHSSLDDGCHRNLALVRSRRVRNANRRLYPDAHRCRSICLLQFRFTSDLFFDNVCRCSHSWLEPSSPLRILPLPPYLIQPCSHEDPHSLAS
jgi:hypothetical protein